MKKKTLELNGQKISYLDEGSKNDPAVLLIHGVPESSMLWKHLIPEISSLGFRAVAPDLPGFGQSDRFNSECIWQNYLHFIDEFKKALGMDTVHLVVHDWGGLIGLRWACDHPEKVESLIISDTSLIPGYKWHPLARKWRTPGVGEEVMKAMANKQAWMENMKKEIPSVDEDILEDFYSIFHTEKTRSVVLELYRSANAALIEPYQELAKIKKPVTILWGEDDPYISPDYAYETRNQQFPHANIHVIPDTGHFIHIEAPGIVIPHVKKHFKDL
jgi:pimeloyl-ACP methyl ester carboxylesterase